MRRTHPPVTPIERDIAEAEAAVREFREKNPHVTVSVLRFCNVLGPEMQTSHARLVSLPLVPMILGFDPRYQFIHADDVVSALEHVVEHELPGIYNAAGDGVLAFSEVIGLLGKRPLPILPPFGTGVAIAPLRRLGLRFSPEMASQLRYGRGLDNRKLKGSGFRYRHTTRETVSKFAEHLRLRSVLRSAGKTYHYEKEVEDFLRWSPSVRNRARVGEKPLYFTSAGVSARQRLLEAVDFDLLDTDEAIALIGGLEGPDLETLRDHEQSHHRRGEVLRAIDEALQRA